MRVFFVPLMLSDDGRSRLPAPPGRKIDPDYLPIDPAKFNRLEMREEGLCVAPVNLVSLVQPNALEVAPDSGLRVGLDLTLDDASNSLKLVKSDGTVLAAVKLPPQAGLPVQAEILTNFTPPAQDMDGVLTPLPEGTYLHLQFRLSDGERKDLYMNVQQLVDVYKPGFAIKIEDNIVAVEAKDLLDPHEKLILVKSGRLRTQPELAYDAESETLQILGVNKAVVAAVKLPMSAGTPTDIEYLRDLKVEGYPVSDYLRFTYDVPGSDEKHYEYVEMGKLAQEPEAGDGISIDAVDGKTRINVAYDIGHGLGLNRAKELTIKPSEFVRENDNLIGEREGELYTQINLVIQNDQIILKGLNGKILATQTIPIGGIPTVSEILYGFTPPPGHGEEAVPETGTYLHLHYDVPREEDVYINVTDITGKAGDGITIQNGVISLDVAKAQEMLFPADDSSVVNTKGLISVEKGNIIGTDAQGRLLLRLADIIAPGGPLVVNDDGKLAIDLDKLKLGVSTDNDNILVNGRDGRPYLPGDQGNL